MFALMLWREHRVFPVPYRWARIARIPVVLAAALLIGQLLVPDHGAWPLVLRIGIVALIPIGYVAVGFLDRAERDRARQIVRGLRSRGGSAGPGDTAEPEPGLS